jgi:hypothetical protein
LALFETYLKKMNTPTTLKNKHPVTDHCALIAEFIRFISLHHVEGTPFRFFAEETEKVYSLQNRIFNVKGYFLSEKFLREFSKKESAFLKDMWVQLSWVIAKFAMLNYICKDKSMWSQAVDCFEACDQELVSVA